MESHVAGAGCAKRQDLADRQSGSWTARVGQDLQGEVVRKNFPDRVLKRWDARRGNAWGRAMKLKEAAVELPSNGQATAHQEVCLAGTGDGPVMGCERTGHLLRSQSGEHANPRVGAGQP
eukprot:Skav225446  [mRNA]  locus=scaffold1668:242329:251242:- [translate_table: standard]